jgi:WD40 repeat protein
MIVVQCECGKTLQVPEGTAASKGICPSCRRVLVLPKSQAGPTLRATFTGQPGAIRDLAFSPDGRLLASASANEEPTAGKPKPGETRLWDCASGELAATLQGHTGAVFCAAFDPHAEILVTGGKDRTIAVWEITRGLHGIVTGVKQRTLTGHEHSISSLAFSPRDRLLASASADQVVLWDARTWRKLDALTADRQGVCRIAFSPEGDLLAAAWSSRGAIVVWDVKARQQAFLLTRLAEDDGDDFQLSFSPDGSRLAVVGHDGVRVWDNSACQVLLHLEARGLKDVEFARDGLTFITGGNDLPEHIYVRSWDALSGRRMEEYRGHKRPVTCLALSANGRLLASGSEDRSINLWQLPPSAA